MYCYHCMCEKGDANFCPFCGASGMPETQAHHLQPGTVIGGRYTVGKVLGEGGFGITYIGKRNQLDKIVAIKEYFPHGYCNRNTTYDAAVSVTAGSHKDFFEQGRARFLREAKTLARFQSDPGIVDVIDFIEENNTAYIVMEYLDGITLRDYLKEHGVFDCVQVIRMLMPMMQALTKVHAAGVIHRDISPDNIMILKNGTLKLMDFGAARDFDGDNRSMSVMLKQGYAPEEQYRRNGKQGPWTDVYGICATIYRCITGSVPVESLDRIRQDDLKAPSTFGINISPSLEKALLYGMAVYKDDRCPDMGTLISLFERAMRGEDLTLIADDAVTELRPQNRPIDPNATMCAEENLPSRQPQGYRQPAYVQPLHHQPQQPYMPMPSAPPKKSSNAAVIAVVCVILVLLIAGGAVIAVLLMNRGDDDSHAGTAQSASATEKEDDAQAQATEAAIKMPDLIGMTKEEAIDKLADDNLTEIEFKEMESSAQSPGKIFSQSPKKEKEVTQDTKITLYIAKAPPTEKPAEQSDTTTNSNSWPASGDTIYCIVKNYLNLREAPDVDSKDIGKVWRGQSMTYISTSGEWYYVAFDGAYGYVRSCSPNDGTKYISSSNSSPWDRVDSVKVISKVPSGQQLRKEPSKNSEALGELSPKATLGFPGKEIVVKNGAIDNEGYYGQWVNVTYNGKQGYVYDKYID